MEARQLILAGTVAVALVSATAGCSDSRRIAPSAGSSGAADSVRSERAGQTVSERLEEETLHETNRHRSAIGRTALPRHPQLDQLAREHSRSMAATGSVSHDGFKRRSQAARQAIDGVESFAENVAMSGGETRPVVRTVERWLESPSHRRNLDDDWSVTGVGVAHDARGDTYFTQLFARLHPESANR